MAPSDVTTIARARIPILVRRLVLVALALVLVATGMHQAGRDAPTVDEGVDVSSGLSLIVHHDARMVPEHPVLPRAIAALPALLADPIVPKSAAWDDGDWFEYTDDFIAANEAAGTLPTILAWSRAMVLVEVIGCALLLYLLTKRFFGPDGAFLAAAAWLTTPYVVGIGHFAMIDVPFVLVTLGFCLVLARWADEPSTARTVALGAVLAVAMASRHTALVLALYAAVVVAHRLRRAPRDAVREVAVLTLVAAAGLWLIYRGLAPGGAGAAGNARFEGLIASGSDGSLPVRLVGLLPLPVEWRAGFAYLDLTSTARPASLLGQSWDGGQWWYFPMSAFVKLQMALTVSIVGGWLLAVRRPEGRRGLALFVVGPALAFWFLLLAQPLNLGLRLALPVVALAFVGLGGLATLWQAPATGDRRRVLTAVGVIAALGLVQVASMFAAGSHSLAWTPPPWSPAYRWVSDANLDAGQGLYELRDWAASHDAPYIAFDSTRGLDVEGGSRSMRGVDPATIDGWVAVGVTPLMQTRRDDLAWLRKYCPVESLAGGSVLIYRFESPPDPSPGPERPVGPCWSAEYSSSTSA